MGESSRELTALAWSQQRGWTTEGSTGEEQETEFEEDTSIT